MSDLVFNAWDEDKKTYWTHYQMSQSWAHKVVLGTYGLIIAVEDPDWRELKILRNTGRTDCNGEPLFEGDIIDDQLADDCFEIKYGEGGYDGGMYPYVGFYLEHVGTGNCDGFANSMFSKYIVKLGNRFKNPELVKKEVKR